mmetsp:Transcript_18086/g.22141  ORF Transcript_18086/g.22141 Transcript_18086/m.22141 type:complete len:261 (-) Transcript_18086:52-834(-)
MLLQRSSASNNTTTDRSNSSGIDNPNCASATALSSRSEQDLRVPCYCEENVWRLAYRRLFGSIVNTSSSSVNKGDTDKENIQYYVVFVSNEQKCCPMLHQKASRDANAPCFWDYHVILIQCSKQQGQKGRKTNVAQVLDLDTRLAYPCPLEHYLDETFNLEFADKKSNKKLSPKFRLIRAELFLQHFYSDRMHMCQDGNKWSAPPPTYDCILTDLRNMKVNKKGNLSNLDDFVSMKGKGKESPAMGEVLTLKELRTRFAG